MHHDIQKVKVFSYHNFYLFFPICKSKEFKLFQLLESFKKKVLMHRPSIKLVPGLTQDHVYLDTIHPLLHLAKLWFKTFASCE